MRACSLYIACVQERDTFATWLNDRLQQRPVPAREIERELGISQSLISRYRNGRAVPEVRRLRELGRYLGDERGALIAGGFAAEASEVGEPAGLASFSDAEILAELCRRAPAWVGRLQREATPADELVAEFEGRGSQPVREGSAERAAGPAS